MECSVILLHHVCSIVIPCILCHNIHDEFCFKMNRWWTFQCIHITLAVVFVSAVCIDSDASSFSSCVADRSNVSVLLGSHPVARSISRSRSIFRKWTGHLTSSPSLFRSMQSRHAGFVQTPWVIFTPMHNERSLTSNASLASFRNFPDVLETFCSEHSTCSHALLDSESHVTESRPVTRSEFASMTTPRSHFQDKLSTVASEGLCLLLNDHCGQ